MATEPSRPEGEHRDRTPDGARNVGFWRFLYRVTTCQLVTYFVAGMFAYTLLDYRTLFQSGPLAVFMRPMASPWVAAGAGLQAMRGAVFALVLWPFRRVFLDEGRGWLKLWGLLVGLCIISPAGPAPGSVEGIIYTTLPLRHHLVGLPETVLQTLAFSALLVAWHRRPHRAWGIAMGVLSALVILMSVAGVFLERPEQFRQRQEDSHTSSTRRAPNQARSTDAASR